MTIIDSQFYIIDSLSVDVSLELNANLVIAWLLSEFALSKLLLLYVCHVLEMGTRGLVPLFFYRLWSCELWAIYKGIFRSFENKADISTPIYILENIKIVKTCIFS